MALNRETTSSTPSNMAGDPYDIDSLALDRANSNNRIHAGMLPTLGACIWDIPGPLTCATLAGGPSPKRFQRSNTEGNLSLRNPEPSTIIRAMPEPGSILSHRRKQTGREQRAPPGPTTLQSSPSKRYALSILNSQIYSKMYG